MNRFIFVGLCIGLLMLNRTAQAATYQYTSYSNFQDWSIVDSPLVSGTYTTSMTVTGTVSFSDAPDGFYSDVSGLITAWEISDGRNTLTEANSIIDTDNSYLVTIAGGFPNDWYLKFMTPSFDNPAEGTAYSYIRLSRDGNRAWTRECLFYTSGTCFAIEEEQARTEDALFAGGFWTVTAVPIPAAAWLFGSALLTLAGIKRRKVSI